MYEKEAEIQMGEEREKEGERRETLDGTQSLTHTNHRFYHCVISSVLFLSSELFLNVQHSGPLPTLSFFLDLIGRSVLSVEMYMNIRCSRVALQKGFLQNYTALLWCPPLITA